MTKNEFLKLQPGAVLKVKIGSKEALGIVHELLSYGNRGVRRIDWKGWTSWESRSGLPMQKTQQNGLPFTLCPFEHAEVKRIA